MASAAVDLGRADITSREGEAATAAADLSAFIRSGPEVGQFELSAMLDGVTCGGCVAKIERALGQDPALIEGRVNLSTRRLNLRWQGAAQDATRLICIVRSLGYRAVPFDPERFAKLDAREDRELLLCMGVAGFAAGNVMLLAVSVWAGHFGEMGSATRTFLHWFEALIALPAIAFAGRPFFRSASRALRHGRTNMDVPISLAVIIAPAISIFETIQQGPHVYFDSAVMLLFFLLIGRYLDARARSVARGTAERLLSLQAQSVTRIDADGNLASIRPDAVRRGDRILVASGERVGCDGVVIHGESEIDTSLVTGEAAPRACVPGTSVYAGTLNLGAAIEIDVRATGEGTLLSEIVRLMEDAEQRRGRFVALADRAARLYAPFVHTLALLAFVYWTFLGGLEWQEALMIAVAVLIITCPCALGLAVPAVQVIASGRLMRKGILLKSATALERFATADMVVFDKTGTLTTGLVLAARQAASPETLDAASAMAAVSKHPLSVALRAARPGVRGVRGVTEIAGLGLQRSDESGEWRLGRRGWAGPVGEDGADGPELWFHAPGTQPVRIAFEDRPRPDAAEVIASLEKRGFDVLLLSGDRQGPVAKLAGEVGIKDWRAGLTPSQKVETLERLRAAGRLPLMVGDGLNDAPALAAAHGSISPSSAADISQTAADAVFQGDRLAPIIELITVARATDRLVKENFALSIGYNLITVPLAFAGFVTPLIAAIAMSASSILVIGNALRLNWLDRTARG